MKVKITLCRNRTNGVDALFYPDKLALVNIEGYILSGTVLFTWNIR